MKRTDAHREAVYLINHYIENWQYEIARGCAEMAHGIAIISDAEYEKACAKIEKEKENFHIL